MISRREFLEFMAKATALLTTGCATKVIPMESAAPAFQPLQDSASKELMLAEGFRYSVLARFKDVISTKNETVGFASDGLAFLSLHDERSGDGLLWIDHAFANPLAAPKELSMGATILHIRSQGTEWRTVKDSPYNRRIDTQVPNRGAIVTPWRTVLSAAGETDPLTGKTNKPVVLVKSLRHRLAMSVTADGKPIVFSLDEKGTIFKFVSDKMGTLVSGTTKKLASDPAYRAIAIDPKTGDLFVSLSESKRYAMGAILRLSETEDGSGLEAKTEFIGDDENSFVSPGDFTFDPNGNLWVCTSIDRERVGNIPYQGHSTNSIYVIHSGGGVSKVGTSPRFTKFAGPTFSSNGDTLFLSVQPLLSGDRNRDGELVTKNSFTIAVTGSSLRALSAKS